MVRDKHYDSWTEKLPSLDGKVVAITGTTSGTGFWAAVFLIKKNAKMVLLLNRASKRADASLKKLNLVKQQSGSETEIIAIDCNLQSFESVNAAAKNVNERVASMGGIQVLMCNAGVMALPDLRTTDGYDVQMQTNHLSHYILTRELMPSLMMSMEGGNETRIFYHSSSERFIGKVNHEEKYFKKCEKGKLGGDAFEESLNRYRQTKLANLTFTLMLTKKLQEQGIDTEKLKVVCAEPGYAKTSLLPNLLKKRGFVMRRMVLMMYPLIVVAMGVQSAADGSLPMIEACFGSDVSSGDFYIPHKRRSGTPMKTIAKGEITKDGRMKEEKYALDLENQEKVWAYTEAECGKFFK